MLAPGVALRLLVGLVLADGEIEESVVGDADIVDGIAEEV